MLFITLTYRFGIFLEFYKKKSISSWTFGLIEGVWNLLKIFQSMPCAMQITLLLWRIIWIGLLAKKIKIKPKSCDFGRVWGLKYVHLLPQHRNGEMHRKISYSVKLRNFELFNIAEQCSSISVFHSNTFYNNKISFYWDIGFPGLSNRVTRTYQFIDFGPAME